LRVEWNHPQRAAANPDLAGENGIDAELPGTCHVVIREICDVGHAIEACTSDLEP
jgi:hypothetical protein